MSGKSQISDGSCVNSKGVKRLGYSPLQIVTGKGVIIPSLTMGNATIENITASKTI